ncbi:dihydroflavonol-4-reductase [Exophiala aquamarina CBS 119918]|uniref:Dihydroflavonol-4-reductase n=1 Tax=Exophiala aquamarina CBS 119918 TaxID=1182545 RepID=A0A072PS50_9EURO|nr:dihydroflavonol-4-reductase [Exophiala aquamarina CBS 119918]KEF58320.1 dihydroflavonol-4-reductase [Exophiala aquamarina CBS 119918]
MKVLLTGGSGFIAAHCIDHLLQRGHSIVFTVRSDEKGQKILSNYAGTPFNRLSYVIVKDIAKENAFDEAVKSEPPFDAVLHTASPFHLNITDPKDLLDPAIIGTVGLLRAVQAAAPSVTRVVITSSFASMIHPSQHPEAYDETSWNPITMVEAKLNAANAYRASKKFAEKAAWDFIANEKPNFDLATINPPLVLGPVIHYLSSLDSINTSNERIRNMIQGKCKDALPPTFGVYLWADVRDVALAHVKAAEVPEAGGKRFLIAGDTYMTNAKIARTIKDNFPALADRLPAKLDDDMPKDVYGYDSSSSKQVLKLDYRKFENCVIDTVESLLAVGA